MIGSRSHLIRGAAIDAILDGTEKIIRKSLRSVKLRVRFEGNGALRSPFAVTDLAAPPFGPPDWPSPIASPQPAAGDRRSGSTGFSPAAGSICRSVLPNPSNRRHVRRPDEHASGHARSPRADAFNGAGARHGIVRLWSL